MSKSTLDQIADNLENNSNNGSDAEFELEMNADGKFELIKTKTFKHLNNANDSSDSETEIFIDRNDCYSTAGQGSEVKTPRPYRRKKPYKKKVKKDRENKEIKDPIEIIKKAEEENVNIIVPKIDEIDLDEHTMQAGVDYPKEASYVFPAGTVKIVTDLLKNTMKFDLTYWHVKDIVALLVLSKLYGASNLSILKNLNFPRLRKYTIKEIREKFSILQKKQIILRNSRDKSKFYVNHDTLAQIVNINVERQRCFIRDNLKEMFENEDRYVDFNI